MNIRVAARQSPLSQAQLQEVQKEIQIGFIPVLMESRGDKDQKTSLRDMEKNDFFTREVDEAVLNGEARIAIHSAKDLPDPIPDGLAVIALTKGVDPSDSLVMRPGTLPNGALIATSSVRREEAVRAMRSDLRFCDIRGTIEKRLEKLWDHTVDGVVIAEAALIRLGLTHLNRITIPGEVAPYQGQLAILARADDTEMREIFAPLDCRKRELYLGIDRPAESLEVYRDHIPMIEIVPLPFSKPDASFTHVVFTSKTAVRLFFSAFKPANLTYIAVGKATAKAIEKEGAYASLVAENEQAEGIVSMLEQQDLSQAHIYWPHSALARPVLADFFRKNHIKFTESIIYTTRPRRPDPLPDLSKYGSLFFTSPSTVDAFVSLYSEIPTDKTLRCQGNITKKHLDDLLKSLESKRMTLITS